MARFTHDGRIAWNTTIEDEGDKLIQTDYLMDDMERLFDLTAHVDPIYSITSTYPTKAITGSYIVYRVKVKCTNNQGGNLTVHVPTPVGMSLTYAWSSEGAFSAPHWTPTLNMDYEATIVLMYEPTGTGAQQQIVDVDGTAYSLTKTCTNYSSDSDGNLNYVEALVDDYFTTSNMSGGYVYTITAYSKVNDPTISAPYDGIKNNRLSLVNGTNVIYGERVTTEGAFEKVQLTFQYSTLYDLKIRLHGQYQTVSTSDETSWSYITMREGYGNLSGDVHTFKLTRDSGNVGFGYMLLVPTDLTIDTPNSDAISASRDVRTSYEV